MPAWLIGNGTFLWQCTEYQGRSVHQLTKAFILALLPWYFLCYFRDIQNVLCEYTYSVLKLQNLYSHMQL